MPTHTKRLLVPFVLVAALVLTGIARSAVEHRPLNCSKMMPRNALHCAKAQNRRAHVQLRHPSTRHSPGYWHWRIKVTHRWIRTAKYRLAHNLPVTHDWVTAVWIVQRSWPGTAQWLLSCSSGEGGHGAFVMNYQGSGAGGWMQYMESTFNSHIGAALYEARTRHLALPPAGERGWYDPLGQAFAAGWARYHHSTSAWSPGIDPACA